MNTNNVEMIIRRKQGILVPEAQGTPAPESAFATFLGSLEVIGYTLSKPAAEAVRSLNVEQLTELHNMFLPELHKAVGNHVLYTPLYPNFPKQVMDASIVELYLNAFMHYLGDSIGLRITPAIQKEKRETVRYNFNHLRALNLVTEAEFTQIFEDLLASKASFSPVDITDINWFADNCSDEMLVFLPENIPNRENFAHLIASLYTNDKALFEYLLKSRAKTATDVLRVAVAIAAKEGSVSLAAYPHIKFGNFAKPTRRVLLSTLNAMVNPQEDMNRYAGLWKILGEKLHPGQYANRYPKAYEAFSDIRSGNPVQSFASRFEALMEEGNVSDATELAITRPGEFARRLDYMLRVASPDERTHILTSFAAVAPKVATNVLWKMRSHFQKRTEGTANRYFYLKGDLTRIKAIPNEVPVMDTDLVSQVVEICSKALMIALSEREGLGKVYVDPQLSNHTVPEAVRSANRSLNIAGRGTRVSFGDDNIQRFFLWWKDGEDRTDLDLSVNYYDEGFKPLGAVWYSNLLNQFSTHSGDITSAPFGASEFIDIDVAKAVKSGVRYATMSVMSFTGQPLHTLAECFAGVMSREDMMSGEIYEPRTVRNIFDLSASSTLIVPMVIDLWKREYIWADVSAVSSGAHINVAYEGSRLVDLSRSIVEKEYVSLYDVFELNALGRGTLVSTPEEADIVFGVDASGRVTESVESILANYV